MYLCGFCQNITEFNAVDPSYPNADWLHTSILCQGLQCMYVALPLHRLCALMAWLVDIQTLPWMYAH
jgi:hypothetical protein